MAFRYRLIVPGVVQRILERSEVVEDFGEMTVAALEMTVRCHPCYQAQFHGASYFLVVAMENPPIEHDGDKPPVERLYERLATETPKTSVT